ncbi:galactose-1-phosphate uridylyltransferase [Blastococcus sp. SYSU D00695]
MIRTSRVLADGREIVYYDADGSTATHDAPDRRDLPPVGTRSRLRWDALLGEWVAYAAHRQTRTFLPPADECPLCPTRPGRPPTEVPDADYQVVVFENRFPSLATGVDRDVPPAAPGAPHAAQRPGLGRCEVVVFTSDHDRAPADLSPERLRLLVDVWADRTEALSALEGVEYVFPFENHGEEIGVTLSHPHGQVYGYSYLPARAERVLASVERHRAAGGDLFAEVVAAERGGPRVVTAGEHWTAFVPAAARWPYELQLFPHRRVPDLPALTAAERDSLAEVLRDALGRFAHRFDEPMNYIAAWNQAPVRRGREDWWLHLQLFSLRRAPGKLKYLAGSESGMGAFISDTDPEDVAEQLRAVVLP